MDKLIEALKLAKPETDIGDFLSATNLYEQGIIDSMDIIVIIDEINAAFGIELGAADIGRDDIKTVDSMYELVRRFGGE